MTEHPITPPPHLMNQWDQEAREEIRYHANECSFDRESLKLIKAARWAADQELEACCEWLKAKEWIHSEFSDELRAARRPKPRSLADDALKALDEAVHMSDDMPPEGIATDQADTIRAALERLRELEGDQ